MNTALIAHIMNQRLKKGEIWPAWWDGMPWPPRKWGSLLALLGIFTVWILPVPWIFQVHGATAIFGRALFIFSLGIMWVDAISVLGAAYLIVRKRVDRGSIELLVLVHHSVQSAVVDWFIPDVLTLYLRMMRYIPLIAIAAAVPAVPWADCALVVALTFAAATAALALLYAATIAAPYTTATPVIVGLLAALWFSLEIRPFGLDLVVLRHEFPTHLIQLALFTVAGLAVATIGLNSRTLT